MIAIFCSIRCPGDIILKIYNLARTLRSADVTVIGGFQTPVEKECLLYLLRGTVRVCVCPARGLGRFRVPAEWKKPIAEERLKLLSFFDDGIRRATTATAAERNARIAALADRLLIVYAEPGGKTERLAREAIASGKPVFTLDSPDNSHLVGLGATPIRAEDPTPLLKGPSG